MTTALGQSITQARIAKSLSQRELAHKIGLSGDEAGAYISRIESGSQEPRLDKLRKIASALGTTLAKLLDNATPVPRTNAFVRRGRLAKSRK